MKKSLIFFAISLVMIACGSQNNKTESTKTEVIETIDPANLETIEIAVIGMTCGGCERTVQTAVGNLPGVQSVKASHSDSTAFVTFDPSQTTFDAMKAAIIDKGYTVEDFTKVEKPQ